MSCNWIFFQHYTIRMWKNTLLICSDGSLIWPENVSASVLLCHCCKKKILVITKTKSLSLDPLLLLVGLQPVNLRRHLAEGGQIFFSRSHINDQQVIVAERAVYRINILPSPPLSYCHCWLSTVRTRIWAGSIVAVTSGLSTFYIVSIRYHWYCKDHKQVLERSSFFASTKMVTLLQGGAV
jgi:hypothetical protein